MVREASRCHRGLPTVTPVEYWWTRPFFDTLPNKRLIKKKKSSRDGKQSKKRITIFALVTAASLKRWTTVVIWRSKIQRCFPKLVVPIWSAGLHYFAKVPWSTCWAVEMKKSSRDPFSWQCTVSLRDHSRAPEFHQIGIFAKKHNFKATNCWCRNS